MARAGEKKKSITPGIMGDTYYLHALVRLPSEQGKGLSKALLNDVETIARYERKQMGLVAMSRDNVSSCACSKLIKLGGSCVGLNRFQAVVRDNNHLP